MNKLSACFYSGIGHRSIATVLGPNKKQVRDQRGGCPPSGSPIEVERNVLARLERLKIRAENFGDHIGGYPLDWIAITNTSCVEIDILPNSRFDFQMKIIMIC